MLAPRGARTCTKGAGIGTGFHPAAKSLSVSVLRALLPLLVDACTAPRRGVRGADLDLGASNSAMPSHWLRTSARQRQEGSLHAAPETTTPRTIARLLRDRRSASPTTSLLFLFVSYTQRLCPGDETWSPGLPRFVLRVQTPRLQGERRAAEGDSAALGSTGRPVHRARDARSG